MYCYDSLTKSSNNLHKRKLWCKKYLVIFSVQFRVEHLLCMWEDDRPECVCQMSPSPQNSEVQSRNIVGEIDSVKGICNICLNPSLSCFHPCMETMVTVCGSLKWKRNSPNNMNYKSLLESESINSHYTNANCL